MSAKKWGMAGLGLLVTGALVLGSIGFSGIAQAQTPGDGNRSGHMRGGEYLEALAQKLGVSVEQLRDASREARNQIIDQAVAAGRISKEEGERLKRGPVIRRPANGDNRPGMRPPADRDNRPSGPRPSLNQPWLQGRLGGFAMADVLDTLAGSLGITRDQLSEELKSGKSLADIGAERGRTPEMLKNTLINEIKGKLQERVDAGQLNQRVMDRIVQGLDQILPRLINAEPGRLGQDRYFPGQRPGPQRN